MATAPLTFVGDAIPIGDPAPSPTDQQASALQGAVAYGATQNPDKYAKLLQLQQRTGVGPVVSQGNEDLIQQAADAKAINYPQFATTSPRTTAWASDPGNAAVSGVSEIQRLGGIENNRNQMSAWNPSTWETIKDAVAPVLSTVKQNLYAYPLTRMAISAAAGTIGTAGDVGSFLGWHGSGPTKQNLLQTIESSLKPENAFAGDPNVGVADYAKSTGMDQVAPLLASMAVGMGEASAVGWAARTFGWTENAAKVATALSVGVTFSAQQGGAAYTSAAGTGASDDAARLAANRIFGINLPGNTLAGFADMIPGLNKSPLLASVGTGALMGGSAKVGSNIVTGQPWSQGALLAAGQAAAIQGGMHLGMSTFGGNLSEAVDAAADSPLKARSPEKFHEALQGIFGDDPSLRIPVDAFNSYFSGQKMDPQAVASDLGSTNYAEAHMAGGDVEVPTANFLSNLDPEHQKALLPDIIDPASNLTGRQFEQGRQELADWEANGGTQKTQADMVAADAETASSPEYTQVKEDLNQRYVAAGETPEVAETLATKDANVYTNMAREAGMKPSELLSLYNPKVVLGARPEEIGAEGSPDRRTDTQQRQSIDQMTPEQMRAALLTSEKTGLPNKRAFDDAQQQQPASAVAMSDADGLKALNDKFGYDAGDALLKAKADSLREAGVEAYHDKGDEFLYRGDSPEDLSGKLDQAREILRKRVIETTTKDGVVHQFKGADFSYGTGKDTTEAEAGLKQHKSEREASGERARGELRGISQVGSEDANEHQGVASGEGTGQVASDVLHQSSEEGTRGWFRTLPDGSFEIGKTKIGDLSTFVHEPAHSYLFMLRDLAGREGSSDTLKGDYAKVLDFLGAKDGEPLTTEQHEKWAEANEQYLRDGKAPSPSLKGTFLRFAVWLGHVYNKAIAAGVELSPEIRGVFDRMYAAEDGVNRAATEAGPQLFKTPEEAGWTEEQFKNYAEMKGMSVEQAKSDILGKLNEAAVRDRSDAWREEEKNVRQGVTDTVDAQPEYRAIRNLRKGELEDGTPLTLNKDALVQRFGEDRVKALQEQHPGLYRTEGGTDAETAAEIHGFGSGEEMMRAMEAAPRRSVAIDTATRDFMTATHGDIRYDGSLQDESDVALMNDQRAESLHKELDALNRRNTPEFELRNAERELKNYLREQTENGKQETRIEKRDQRIEDLKSKISTLQEAAKQRTREERAGKRIARDVAPIAAYREAAQNMVQAKSIVDLQPTRYLDASRKYSTEAFEALAKGDYEGAQQAKHKELLNHFLFREAQTEKTFVTKQFEPFVKRVQSKLAQQNLGKAGLEYRAQFNKLLARYEIAFVPRSEAPEGTLAQWASDQYDMGKEPAIDAAIYNEMRTASYRTIPLSELHQVHDALQNIRALANQELHMMVNGRRVDFAEATASMISRAHESLKSAPTRVLERNATVGEKASDLVDRGNALLMRTEFLMKRLDGGTAGPWHDNLWNLASDAQGKEHALQADVTQRLADSFQAMTKEQRLSMLKKVTIDGITEPITRHDLVSMAMNMGNDGNFDRLTKTFEAHGWNPEALEQVHGALTREEWQHVQNVWDLLKPLGAHMNEMEKRLTGVPPAMVTPTPFRVEFPDGTGMDLDGGYYPIMMDPKFSKLGATADAGMSAQNLMESGYGRAETSKGYTKGRTGYGGPLLLDYEQVLTQHTAKVIKDITHREFMLTANKLLMNQDVRNTLRSTLGAGYEEKMMPWLRTIINDRNGSAVQGLGDVSRVMRTLRTNIVKAALSFKASTILLQTTHASSMFTYTSPSSYAQSMIDFMAHPQAMSEQIRGLSPNEMAFRGENIDRDLRTLIQTETGQKGIGHVIARAGMMPVQLMDHIMSFPLWLSVYRDALTSNVGLAEGEAKYAAMHKADAAVRMGLGSNAPKDLPPIMRNNDFTKIITTLGGFANLKFNQMSDQVSTYRSGGSVAKLTYGMLMVAIIPPILGQLVTGHGPKDGENVGEWAAKTALLFPAETIPVLGNIMRGMEGSGDVSFSPLEGMLARAGKAGARAASDSEEKDWPGIGLDALQTGMEAYGVTGTDQAFKTIHYVRNASDGKIENPNALNAVVGGQPSKP